MHGWLPQRFVGFVSGSYLQLPPHCRKLPSNPRKLIVLVTMDVESSSFYLKEALEQGTQIIHKRKSSVLFRRGDRAAGMFVVLSGRVILDAASIQPPVVVAVPLR